MNKAQAKMILVLEEADTPKRNVYFIAGAFGKGTNWAYTNLRILSEQGYLRQLKSQMTKKVFFEPTPESIEEARKTLSEADDVL